MKEPRPIPPNAENELRPSDRADLSQIRVDDRQPSDACAILSAVAANTPQLAWTADAHGQLDWVNKGWLDYTGTTLEQNTGDGWRALLHPDHVDAVTEKFERHLWEGVDWEETFPLRADDGSFRWFLSQMHAVRNKSGQVERFFGTHTDATEHRAAHERLRLNAETFSRLIVQSPFGVYAVDAEFRIAHVSSGARSVFANVQPLLGRDFGEAIRVIWPAPFAEEVLDIFRHTLATGDSYLAPSLTEKRADVDAVESYEWQVHRITLPDGRHGVVCYFFDSTRIRQAQDAVRVSEVRYRRLFQTAKDGILILDAHTGKITDANAFMGGLVGVEAHRLLGKELHEIGLFGDAEASKQAVRALQENGYIRYEHLPVKNQTGGSVEVEVVANVYEEDKVLVAQCNIRDISQRVVMEKKIAEQATSIALESRRKDEFLAMLSHELRNPLAPIRAAVHLLKATGQGTENPLHKQAREIIDRQSANMNKLINDLLEVSRVLTGRIRLDIQLSDLTQVIRNAAETVGPMIQQHRHELTMHGCERPIWVNADATRIEEVFVSLLNNAAKYTPDGGRIDVWCECPRGMNIAQVRVRDNGAGIDRELLPSIFDLFTQADRSLARSQGGLGVGLSLAHRLVDMHGGSLEVKSPPDGAEVGSEFIVRLTLLTEEFQQSLPDAPDTDTQLSDIGTGLRVLVVDDNFDLVVLLAMSLRQNGYAVQTAYNGADGLSAATKWRPDIVLLDIGLPGLNGYEVARRLRADAASQSAGRRMRLIAMSGYGREADLTLAREAGFEGHLTKPFEFKDLETLIAAPISH